MVTQLVGGLLGWLVSGPVGCPGKNLSRIFEDVHGHLTKDINQNPQMLHSQELMISARSWKHVRICRKSSWTL